MKVKTILKSIALLAVLPVLAFIFAAGGKSSDASSGKKCPTCLPNTNPPYIEKTQEADLVLYNNLTVPAGRLSNYTVPVSPSLWNGNLSAASLYDTPNSKYYCLVTVLNANGYQKSYVWNSLNKSNTMKIQLPLNNQFQIRVEYYEKCGPFWAGGVYGRGKWYSEITTNWVGSVAITQWVYLITESC